MNTGTIITAILQREGGFVDRPADRGGPTKFGITLSTLELARGKACTRQDVAGLTEPEARTIYEKLYIHNPGFDRIADERLAGLAVDCAVHSGTGRAVRWLQEAAGVPEDGVLGVKSLAAVNADPAAIYRRLLAIRIRYLGHLVSADPTQAGFAAGWFNRIAEFVEE